MTINELTERIVILKQNDSGVVKSLSNKSYEAYKPLWAKIEYVSSKEIYSANANNTLDVVKFIVRYTKVIKSDMRIKHDGSIYKIKGQRPLDKRKTYLLITGELIKHE